MLNFAAYYNQNGFYMKRLFLSVFALAFGAFAFISCNDDDKINKGGNDSERYLTVQEQQQAITTALDGVADAISFTDFSHALEFAEEIMGSDIELMDLAQALGSPAVLEDSLFQDKLGKAVILFAQDTVAIDLSPLYMSADLFITDTVLIDTAYAVGEGGGAGNRIDTTYTKLFILDNIRHDVDYLQLNVFVNNHKLSLKANVRAGESVISVSREEKVKTVYLPKSADISISLDDKVLAALNGQYTSDMSLYVEDVEDAEDIVRFEGTQFSASATIKVVSYELSGGVKYDQSKGIEANLAAKYDDYQLLSINGKVDAVFEGLDIQDTTAVLVWAQNPEKLKSISLNASLGGGKVEIKGVMDSPFKDEELATTLRSLMVPGATITDEKAKETIERLNGIINAGIYFEGFKNPQATLRFVFGEARESGKGKGVINSIEELFDRTGAYPVLIAHDADGNEVEVSFEEYFGKIDVSNLVSTVKEKFQATFGDFIGQFDSDK